MWLYFWTLYSVPLIHSSVFVPIPCCFDYHSFVILSEVQKGYASFVLFPQNFFGHVGSFMVPYIFQDYLFQFWKNAMGNLIKIALNLYITLGSMAILTILILPTQSMGYLSISLNHLNFLINVLQLLDYRCFTSLIKFITRCFISFDVILNETVYFL